MWGGVIILDNNHLVFFFNYNHMSTEEWRVYQKWGERGGALCHHHHAVLSLWYGSQPAVLNWSAKHVSTSTVLPSDSYSCGLLI